LFFPRRFFESSLTAGLESSDDELAVDELSADELSEEELVVPELIGGLDVAPPPVLVAVEVPWVHPFVAPAAQSKPAALLSFRKSSLAFQSPTNSGARAEPSSWVRAVGRLKLSV
jgi:hypothetical protein